MSEREGPSSMERWTNNIEETVKSGSRNTGETMDESLGIEQGADNPKRYEYKRPRTPEKSAVIMKFMRHGPKGSEGADPALTEPGREQARLAGLKHRPKTEFAVGRGSPRHRTEETVQRFMAAERPDVVTDSMTSEQVESAIEAEMTAEGSIGHKTIADTRLNFENDGDYKVAVLRAVDDERYLKFLIEESDKLVLSEKDSKSTSLLRQAGNVANLIKNYGVGAAKGWRKVCEEKPADYMKSGYELERYLGTHTGVVESFVIKMLSQKQGEAALTEFVDAYPNGFSELGGVEVDVEMKDNKPQFILAYEIPAKEKDGSSEKRTVEFDLSDLDSIIYQREAFERKVEKAAEENS